MARFKAHVISVVVFTVFPPPLLDDHFIKAGGQQVAGAGWPALAERFDTIDTVVEAWRTAESIEAARVAAEAAANLVVGTVTTQNHPTVPAGDVISQNPAACTMCVSAGSAVDLVVSSGAAPVTVT